LKQKTRSSHDGDERAVRGATPVRQPFFNEKSRWCCNGKKKGQPHSLSGTGESLPIPFPMITAVAPASATWN